MADLRGNAGYAGVEVLFGRRIGSYTFLLPFLRMKVGVCCGGGGEGAVSCRAFVAATEDGYRGCRECLPAVRRNTANLGWRNIADRLGVRHLIDLPAK